MFRRSSSEVRQCRKLTLDSNILCLLPPRSVDKFGFLLPFLANSSLRLIAAVLENLSIGSLNTTFEIENVNVNVNFFLHTLIHQYTLIASLNSDVWRGNLNVALTSNPLIEKPWFLVNFIHYVLVKAEVLPKCRKNKVCKKILTLTFSISNVVFKLPIV